MELWIKMIKPIRAILQMLQGRIILEDNTLVPIIKRDFPLDKTPCITIDNSGGSSTVQKNIINKDFKLSSTHPLYDVDNPDKTISKQVIRKEKGISLDLNVWMDNEDQRDEIDSLMSLLFNQIQSDHYTFCTNYADGTCSFLDDDCPAPTTLNGRGAKSQCPNPYEYHYQNIFNRFDIRRSTFNVEDSYILDDNTMKPPALRSITRVSFNYYDYYVIGGAVSQDLIVNEELL